MAMWTLSAAVWWGQLTGVLVEDGLADSGFDSMKSHEREEGRAAEPSF
jgi:hypothetical protein